MKDYVKAIHLLGAGPEQVVTTTALADRLSVTSASASGMVKRLAERDLARHRRYHGVTLTASGTHLALRLLRRHRLIESFLARELGMPWDRAHATADLLEPAISEELEALIAAKLGWRSSADGGPADRRRCASAPDATPSAACWPASYAAAAQEPPRSFF